jgi:hypothetical protein
MPELHAIHGFINQIRVFLVEHRSVNQEWNRRAALECGMIFDLGVHNVTVIQELVPPTLSWTNSHGHQFRRERREIEAVTCARGRTSACILQNQEAETFAAIELRITERVYR